MVRTALADPKLITAAPPTRGARADVNVSRWFADEPHSNQTQQSAYDEHLVSVCLRATRLELRTGAVCAFDGIMRAGTLHVIGPGRQIAARFRGPCDVIHLHVASAALLARLAGMGADLETLSGLDGCTFSDSLVEQLARLLLSAIVRADTIYTTAIGQTILTRILHLAQRRAPVGALAKWRLRRVQALVDAHLAETLTLSDMAAAAGLSRMHFAAQFRSATGSSPHEYLLSRRIEAAQALLADTDTALVDIALAVGFLAQAHFTTVFKRLAGETPARWRRRHREIRSPGDAFELHEASGASPTLYEGSQP